MSTDETELPNSRATIEEAAAAFAKKRWPDDRFARRKFIAGAVFALDEALGFGGAEQPKDAPHEQVAIAARAIFESFLKRNPDHRECCKEVPPSMFEDAKAAAAALGMLKSSPKATTEKCPVTSVTRHLTP